MDATSSAAGEWRRNWTVVLAGAAGGSLATIHLYSTGVMIAPLEQEFGWSRAFISSGVSIVSVVGVILSPFLGMLVDRIGARRVALTGAILFCLLVASLSLATSDEWSWWGAWFGIAVSAACIVPPIWTAGVAGLFDRARGMALAVTLCGTSIGSLLVPMVTYLYVDAYGWRTAYLALTGTWALVALPLIYFFFTSPIDRRRKAGETCTTADPQPTARTSARDAFLTMRFVKLAGAAVAIVTVISSLLHNYVPILTEVGHTTGRAAAIAGLLGLGSIIGRISGGYLLDRIDGRFVAGLSVLIPIITCLLLIAMPESVAAASAAILIMGLAAGIEWDAVAYLASRHFGVQNIGTVFSTIGGLVLLMNGMGPFLTNHVYDVTGSYVPALWAFIPLCVLSSILFLSLGRYPSVGTEPSAQRPSEEPAAATQGA